VLGVTLGYLVIDRNTVADAKASVVSEVKPAVLVVDLAPDSGFTPRREMADLGKTPAVDQSVFFWGSPHYSGDLTGFSVRALIDGAVAEALLSRLSAKAQAELNQTLEAFDRELREMILLVEEENEQVKRALLKDPTRCIHLSKSEDKRSRSWLRYVQALKETDGGKGAVWGQNTPSGPVQLVVKWSDWPKLKKLHDERTGMVRKRTLRVRSWIRTKFQERGMALFGL